MTETVQAHAQRAALDATLELFTFDFGVIGGEVYRFVNDARAGGVAFAGVAYLPRAIKSDGWQRAGRGTLPRPTITLANVDGLFSYLNLLYDDLLGVGVTRMRVFAWALDGEPSADPNAIRHPIDKYAVARKLHQDDETASYELAAKIDLEGRQFPGRLMAQNYCDHIYRRWDAGLTAFDYSKATCPFAGSVYRTRTGQPTIAALDQCAKTLPECLARFGVAADLPFRGFPGIDRVRL